ncbi:hypothetical protein [Halobaculum magnesiiphilum]|uniref:Uncharacterized protein n=1 Tax=Halobaculum magnesiiphilum TaxID=1017351 RepID=A0A8T8WIF3_9EURY|nr:hypothetical protein [Halobaculum magnesiiphilum]QZP39610.1 hypothetical protein K6T50_16595 [Halobaculum magnesiiphilum]
MAFDDLDQAEQAEDEKSETQDAAEERDASEPVDASVTEADLTADPGSHSENRRQDETGTRGSSSSTSEDTSPHSEPAFGFEEAKQRPLYARQRAWDEFEDALAIDVEPTLRRHDVRDTSKRELHDAALRVLADHAEEVANKVLEARGLGSNLDE